MRKTNYPRTARVKASKIAAQNEMRELLNSIVTHSVKIAQIRQSHKRFQNIFENRLIKKEENFILKDTNFTGRIYPTNNDNLKWTFISKTLGKLITVENTGEIKLYDFNTQNHNIYTINNEEDEVKLLSVELFEHEPTAECKLLLLYQDLTFYNLDLILLTSPPEKEEEYDIQKIINSAISKPFDFKPYIPIGNIDTDYIQNEKIIIFPKTVNDNCRDIILNFSQLSGKIFVFNFYSNSIIGNYIINHKDLEEDGDNNNLNDVYNFITFFVNKIWTLKQYEFASAIIEDIINTKNENTFKKLTKVLSMNDKDDDDVLEKIKNDEIQIDEQEINEVYSNIISPVIKFNLQNISIYTILKRLKEFYEKMYEGFKAHINNDFSLIKGENRVLLSLFLKCFSRNINLKNIFKYQDKENKGYVDEKVARLIFNDLPLGFTNQELDEIFSSFNIIDENNKYMYNYLFDTDEYLISKIISFSPLNKKENEDNKNTFSCNCTNINLEQISENEVLSHIINSIFNKRELTDILYLKTCNLIFVITSLNRHIYIFKRETKLSELPECLVKIGTINLNSYYNNSPLFLSFIEERNLLITQKTEEKSTELVFINIYEDLILPFKDKKYIKYNVESDSKKVTKNLIKFYQREPILFDKLIYLKRNEIMLLYNKNNIYLINPKIPSFDLSLKMNGNKKTIYTDICKSYCENPKETMGQSLLKIFWKKSLSIPIKNVMTFSFVNNLFGNVHNKNYSSTDWFIILDENNEINSFSVNQLYISISLKEIDVPLSNQDYEKLLNFINTKREKSFEDYKKDQIIDFNLYYNMLKKKDKEIINQIVFNIKESLIKGNLLSISPKYFQIQNIYQLVYLLKYLNLNYSTHQLFEMYPELTFDPINFDENSEFFKYEFSLTKKNYYEINPNEEIKIPKTKNLFRSDLTELDTKYSIFDSGLKKLAMFMYKQKMKEKQIFELLDEKKEEILNTNQFTFGCQKIGLLSNNYLNNDELKEIFKRMDTNNNKVITLEEFMNFCKKSDIKNIMSSIKIELGRKIKNPYINSSEAEKFLMLSPDNKIKIIQDKINEINEFYSGINSINDEDVISKLESITNAISRNDIIDKFKSGIIFLDEFKNLIQEKNIEIEENEINDIFAYFDRNNKNYFIFVRDISNYFKENIENDKVEKAENNNSISINNKVSKVNDKYKSNLQDINQKELSTKLTKDKYILIWMGIMKKLIKFCSAHLNISPNEFSDKFIFVKESTNSILYLNFIQTSLSIDKFNQQITNFLSIEKMILFDYYLDYYKYGIIFKENIKSLFDDMMTYIYNQFSDMKDFDFKNFDNVFGNKYVSSQLKNVGTNLRKLEQKYIEELLPIFNVTFLELIFHLMKKNNYKDLNLFYDYLCSVANGKYFLSEKEFKSIIKDTLPIEIYNSKFADNLFDYLSENIILLNEPKIRIVTIPRLMNIIIHVLKQKEFTNKLINHEQICYAEQNKIFQNFDNSISKLKQYNEIGSEIENLSCQYYSLIKEAIFSGLIIVSKKIEIDKMKFQLIDIEKKILDKNNYFLLEGNSLLVKKFNRRLKAINKLNKELGEMGLDDSQYNEEVITKREVDYSHILIPTVIIDTNDSKNFKNIKKYLCGMIESFDYYHPELKCIVNVIKIRKTFLFEEISEVDGQNLLKHIEFSLKVNHYLQKEYLSKSSTIKSFEDFHFLRNFGVFSKEIVINQRIEEEYYIINEKINQSKYISLYSLIKSNGGLLQIPELINTDMAFYILRYWGKNILNILSDLFKINVNLKYFTTKDFYVSYDGKKIKMANLLTYSFCDMKGNIYSGPDILKILIILEDIQFSQLDDYNEEQKEEIFSNAYIPPEIIRSNTKLTSKIDSWVFGIILFNILFGHSPISYYEQLKQWYEFYYCQHFTKDVYDIRYMNPKYHFYFNPFSNVDEIMQDKTYFLKALKLKSFSAVVKKKHLNLATENNNTINGIGIIFDMINSCLSIDPRKRPYLSSLMQCDLFSLEPQELVLCNKFLINVLNYYSPDNVIYEKILIPLRGICLEIIRNEDSNPNEINNYQNFIFNVIRELNIYLFSKTFSAKARHAGFNSENENNLKDDIYIKTPQCFYKNSIIVKYIVELKIVDILIFLVLRHFDANLTVFKKKFNKELRKEMMENMNNLGKIKTGNLITEKKSNYNNEMRHYCGRLISALIDFLYNCIQAMTSYDHALTLYVENVLVWIIKLFIGEDNQLLGDRCDYMNSEDKLKKYLIYRTFMRDENLMLKNEFKEDELDQMFSILNANKNLCEIKSYWCPELYFFTIDLFTEAFGDKCQGNKNYLVIKNYFTTINSYTKNIANQLENPLVNNKINDYLSFIGRDQQIQINYSFVNTDYINEIFSLTNMCTKLFMKNNDENSHLKNLEDKRNGLSFIHTILQNKNRYKIRGCLDFKIHFIIQKFLFTNQNNLSIKKEVFNILKEISLCLIDMNEINWMFGNNFDKVFGELYKEKTDLIDLTETFGYGNYSNWDSNFSIIDFMNKLLIMPHSFVLYFTNRFLSINFKKSGDSYINYMKEFGNIFMNPLCLTPIIKAIKNPKENYVTKQLALDIVFNLMLSNDKRIISNFNLCLCNFYELLVNTVRNCIQLPKHLQAKNDDVKSVEMNADKLFKDSVRIVIKTIIEQQNPYIKTQIFSSPTMLKYMKQNNLVFKARMDIDEIEKKFLEINKSYLNMIEKKEIKEKKENEEKQENDINESKNTKKEKKEINQDKIDGKINFWINCFKCWIFHIGNENIQSYLPSIKNVMYVIFKILNNEWNQGIKNYEKNCLVFNIIKLYEWIIKNHHHEFIFPKDDESFSLGIILNFMNKIRDNNLTMKDLIIKINKMNIAKTNKNYFEKNHPKEISKEKEESIIPNLFGNKSYTLQKLYNYISIKLLNIIYIIFSQNDIYYNKLFEKVKFGVLLSELFKIQYDTISLFLNQENIDTSILDNYMAEVKIRLGLFETMIKLPKQYDDIKLQFLQTDFINYMFKHMIYDFRKFKTDYKKLTLEFLSFKTSYILRAEAISFLNIIFKRNNNINGRTKLDCFIYDEIIRNIKVYNFISNELTLIKKRGKGNEVLSSLAFFNMIISNNEREIIKSMNLLNASDYFVYAIQKDNTIKKLYPFVIEYINKVEKGIEYEK